MLDKKRIEAKNPPDANLQGILEGILGTPFTTGNSIRILRNGIEIFPVMLEAIDGAKHRIEFLTFVYWTGDIAKRFAESLAKKAATGVSVKVLLDSFGASKMPEKLIAHMQSSGVQLEWFRPVPTWRFWKIDNRTHRKILVVDGEIGFTGGVGIAEEWEGDARNPSEWRDTHFMIMGAAVLGLQGAFYNNWAETRQGIEAPPQYMPSPEKKGSARIQVLRGIASAGWSDIATLLELLVYQARKRIRIATAYFTPDEKTVQGLCNAARREIDIDIMMPGPHIDKRVAKLASATAFKPLLEAGIRLWTYQLSMLHTKIILVDEDVTCIGSANFNQRSMRKDDEIALTVISEHTGSILDRQYEEDLQYCKPIVLQRWRNRGAMGRLRETLVRPFKSQM